MKKENQKILTPLVSLDTPGKSTVEVVILADPVSGFHDIVFQSFTCVFFLTTIYCIYVNVFKDAHEICFVGDEAFRELSKVDPSGNALLDKVGIDPTCDLG